MHRDFTDSRIASARGQTMAEYSLVLGVSVMVVAALWLLLGEIERLVSNAAAFLS